MSQRITIQILDKIATCLTETPVVCGNSDYVIDFEFDEEWNQHEVKTAVFSVNGQIRKEVFSGNVCKMPVFENALVAWVGVFAGTINDGTLSTSTPALVHCKPCITDGDKPLAPPQDDVYNQIVALCEEAVATAESVEQRADNGEFDGEPGEPGDKGERGADGTTIWRSTADLTGLGSTQSPYKQISEVLTLAEGETVKAGDYIIDGVGNLVHVDTATDTMFFLSNTSIVPCSGGSGGSGETTTDTGVTIWRTTNDLTGANNSASPYYSTDILTAIEGKTPKVNDYILDGVGNLVRIYSVFDSNFLCEDVSNYNARMSTIEDRLDVVEKGLEAIGDIDTALDGIIAIQNSLIGGDAK